VKRYFRKIFNGAYWTKLLLVSGVLSIRMLLLDKSLAPVGSFVY
jgi:hypothetical protein